MCGITGWIDWERDLTRQREVLDKMVATLAFRGPDASGTWISPRAAIGHRRLSVVDPEGGAQPLLRTLQDHTYVITYNGELYNTPELRHTLEEAGYRFYTHSDTEVLLVSYIHWKDNCVRHLNGIYAFAVWDEKEQSLFMARDRMGVKPLFYTRHGAAFIFGSELKALLANPLVEPVLDSEGLAEVFALGPSRTPGHGVFKGIYEVRPGCSLLLNRNRMQLHRYWSLESRPHADDLETTARKVHELVKDAVSRQLVADVPVCTFLSGGLDSSVLTAFASDAFKKEGKEPLHTYSIDYVDNDKYFKSGLFQPDPDSEWVGRISDFLDTRHHNIIIDIPELTNALLDAMRARDLPGMADVDSSLLLFCREVKKNATVALSGECSDEVFGGYPWFYRDELLNSNTFPWMRNLDVRSGLLSQELVEHIRPEAYAARRYQETLEEVPRLPGEGPMESRRREIFYLNIIWFMNTLLERKDRMSMATGLEVRVPFCDHHMVEYVWNIPWDMKYLYGREKGILRKAMEGVLPQDVLYRKKSPYPKTHHPAYENAVRSWLLEILNDRSSPLLPLINSEAVMSLVEGVSDYDKPWFGQLMAAPQMYAYLIQADTWLRTNKARIL